MWSRINFDLVKKLCANRQINKNVNYNADPRVSEINNPENATFQITDTKLYVPVVTLSKENDIKLLEQLKSGFKRTI